jgi:eukaryotic-like serine/threonine-protein kinase
MSPQRWKRIEELYHSARECDPGNREAFLRDACGDDQPLLDQLKTLLEQDRSNGEILDHPAMDLLSEDGPVELAAGATLGPYRIEFLLGAGGMGRVYKAHDSRLGRSVAIKVAVHRFSDRFGREARATAALNHPNICTLHDIGPNYLVMELVEGPTLADRIRKGPLSPEEAITIARQVADALEAAHDKGIVHRDLKPANIKIRTDGTLKVLDFGLAKEAASGENPAHAAAPIETEPGRILGSAAYMAPEQARGERVDKRADIWAFGVVLYEMLAGRRLFEGATASDTLAAVLKEQPDFNRVPGGVQKLLERCLEKDPKRRLRDIADAIPLLEEAPSAPPARHPWLAWSAAGAVLAAALALSFIHFRQTPSAPESVRFQITLPENMKFTMGGAFAVSPDGRRLVFAAIGPDHVPRLWLRNLNSLDLNPLQGAKTSVTDPTVFWSPDSRFVVFRAEQRLEKIDVSAGLTQTLCEGPPCKVLNIPAGGSWNRSGTIIFGGVDPYSVMQISANGGVPIPVTLPDGPRQKHGYPTFLPDGRLFLYTRWSDVAGERGIFVGSLGRRPEAQDSKMLLRLDVPSAFSMYVPSPASDSGELLFMRQQTLVAQHFNARHLTLSGEPVTVAEHVGSSNFGTGFFSASSNGVLVYRTGDPRTIKQIAWLDRGGIVASTPCEPGRYGTEMLRVSPDGTRALYHQLNENADTLDVWLADLVRGSNMRLTSGPVNGAYPVWSPDGKRLAFGSTRGGFPGIYQKASSGLGGEELLAKLDLNPLPFPPHPYDWTEDGRFLVYSVREPGTKLDLWALPMEPGSTGVRKPVPLLKTEFNEYDGRVSPDGRWLSYLSDRTGRYELYVRPFRVGPQPSADLSESGEVMVSRGTMGMGHWRRDSRELLYMSLEGAVMSVPIAAGPAFSPGTPQILFSVPSDFFPLATMPGFLLDPTPDHKRFLLLLPADRKRRDEFTVLLNWNAEFDKKPSGMRSTY